MVIENLNDKDDDDDVNTEKAKTTNCKWIVSSVQILSCFRISSNGICRDSKLWWWRWWSSWVDFCVSFLLLLRRRTPSLATLQSLWRFFFLHAISHSLFIYKNGGWSSQVTFLKKIICTALKEVIRRGAMVVGNSSSGGGGGGTELILKLVGFTCSCDVLAT